MMTFAATGEVKDLQEKCTEMDRSFFWVLFTLRLIPLSYFLLLLSNDNYPSLASRHCHLRLTTVVHPPFPATLILISCCLDAWLWPKPVSGLAIRNFSQTPVPCRSLLLLHFDVARAAPGKAG